MEELAVFVTVIHLAMIFVVGAVWFLNRTSAGCVVSGYSESQFGAVAEIERGLDEAFSEGPAANDQRAVVVLQGSRNYFRCGSAPLVYENDEVALFEVTLVGGHRFLVVAFVFAFGEHDLFP